MWTALLIFIDGYLCGFDVTPQYNRSLPPAKQTILTFCMRQFLVVGIFVQVWYVVSSVILQFPGFFLLYFVLAV